MPDRTEELERALAASRLNEERWRTIIQATSAIVYVANKDGGSPGTPSWSQFTGQTPVECAGWGWLDAIHPDDRAYVRARWLQYWELGESYRVEYRLRKSNGEYAHMLSRAIPVRAPDGSIREWLGVIQDITALRKSEHESMTRLRELQETQQMLLTQERLAAVGELSAVVAHEIRNPLGAIFNSLNVLKREIQHPLLDVVSEESDRLNRIVGDLLDFARPCVPRLSGDSISHVIAQALSSVRVPLQTQVELKLSEELDVLPMDSRLIRQLFINLFENAVQAMPQGGTLQVTSHPQGDCLEVRVADSGPGIPLELHEKVFVPFYTTKATGTGLGLAVVKRIAESHGGYIGLGLSESGGCEFRLCLPILKPGFRANILRRALSRPSPVIPAT